MIKKAFKMQLYPGQAAEYKRRHDALWPEMIELLKAHGAHSYSIFLDEETHILFGYLEIEDEARWAQVPLAEINRKWWDYMADIMETHANNSPVSVELQHVFDLH